MAEFSKEYMDIFDNEDHDFSYIEYYNELSEGEYIAMICEGFGTFGITKKNNIPYLVVTMEGSLVEYSTFVKSFSESIDKKNIN